MYTYTYSYYRGIDLCRNDANSKTLVMISEVHKQGHMTTGRSVETWGFLTKEPLALSSYALTCVALIMTTFRMAPFSAQGRFLQRSMCF